MKTLVLGRQVNVTEDQKALIEKKLAKFDKFFEDGQATVTLRRTKRMEIVEVTISNKGTLYRAEVEDETFHNALDRCISRIEGQIRKNKTRLEKCLRSGAFRDEGAEEDIPEEGSFRIRTKTFAVRPVTTEEAILQMNLLGHNFYMFEDVESGKISVVYRRHEDEYGVIVPQ